MIALQKRGFIIICCGWLLTLLFSYSAYASANQQQDKMKQVLANSHANVLLIANKGHSNRPFILHNRIVRQNTPENLTRNRLIPIGSTQKIVTGALILQAIHHHRLSLKTPLNRFFPQIQGSNHITIENLLTHTSGLGDRGRFANTILANSKEQLNYSLEHYQYTGSHGWQYASINYVLLAGILEKIYHHSYATILKQQVLAPYHLHKTKLYYQVHQPTTVTGSLLLSRNQSNDWNLICRQLSTTLGAGDLLVTPFEYWTLLNQLNHNDFLYNSIAHAKIHSTASYIAGYYVRANGLHSNGTVSGYTCEVYTNGRQTMILFSNSLSSKATNQLATKVAKVYFN